MKMTSALILPAAAVLSLLGCATVGGVPGQPEGSFGGRVMYDPEVVLASFGEPNFERDAAVAKTYEKQLKADRDEYARASRCDGNSPSGQRTARERLEGTRAEPRVKKECPPAKMAQPPDVQVLVDAMPDGIEVVEGRVRVTDGAGYTLLSRVQWRSVYGYTGVPKSVIVSELKFLAHAAGANLVLMSFVNESTAKARAAVALLLHADQPLDPSKRKVGRVPTEI